MRYMYIIPAVEGEPIVKLSSEILNNISKWTTTGDKIIFYSDKLIDDLMNLKDIKVIDTLNNKRIDNTDPPKNIVDEIEIKDIDKEIKSITDEIKIINVNRELKGSLTNKWMTGIPHYVTIRNLDGGLIKATVHVKYSLKPYCIVFGTDAFLRTILFRKIPENEFTVSCTAPVVSLAEIGLGVPAHKTIDYEIKFTGKILTIK